jgi:hypothetical protein
MDDHPSKGTHAGPSCSARAAPVERRRVLVWEHKTQDKGASYRVVDTGEKTGDLAAIATTLKTNVSRHPDFQAGEL